MERSYTAFALFQYVSVVLPSESNFYIILLFIMKIYIEICLLKGLKENSLVALMCIRLRFRIFRKSQDKVIF